MKTPDGNNLDRLFREGLSGSDGKAEFREEDWVAMENLLDEKPRKVRGLFWLYLVSGSIAACLLLFFGWMFLKPITPAGNKIAKAPVKKASPLPSHKVTERKNLEKTTVFNNSDYAQTKKIDLNTINKLHFRKSKSQTNKNKVEDLGIDLTAKNLSPKNSIASDIYKDSSASKLAANQPSTQKNELNLPADQNSIYTDHNNLGDKNSIQIKATAINTITTQQALISNQEIRLDTSFTAIKSLKNKSGLVKSNKKAKPVLRNVPQLSLAILTAPDVNGISSFAGAKIGTNAGIQLNIQLKKWSVSTGAGYAIKPYGIGGTNSYSGSYVHTGTTTSVAADCRVLDIPLNVSYQFLGNAKNRFSAGTGLSTYLMLREHYEFYYSDNTEWNYSIANKNKHVLSVLNLNATYQRRINSKFGLMIQPYLKLPLKQIGYEKVNLQSAGVAVGVGWNIGSLKIK
jgi:hypothetical protein